MPVTVRQVSLAVTFASVGLTNVTGARGQVRADGGWPTCSVFVPTKPATGNEEDPLAVVAGAGNNVTRFTGRVRGFRSTAFPPGIEMVGMGTLGYAAEWSPGAVPLGDTGGDILFDDVFPHGATDQQLVMDALDHVPQLGPSSYSSGDIDGTGITLGLEAPEAFDWKVGTSAWSRIQKIDQATQYRTYQTQDGTIRRVQMIGHPHTTTGGTQDFTLAPEDLLEGSTGNRDTKRTRNAVTVTGHDYGDGLGAVANLDGTFGTNTPQGDGSDPTTRYTEEFSSDLIESGTDEDGTPDGRSGLNASDIAALILPDVNKEFVEAEVDSWRDDTHGPGLTCLLDTLALLAIGESMWVAGYGWEAGDNGWQSHYSLTGGGLEQTYSPPDV